MFFFNYFLAGLGCALAEGVLAFLANVGWISFSVFGNSLEMTPVHDVNVNDSRTLNHRNEPLIWHEIQKHSPSSLTRKFISFLNNNRRLHVYIQV